MPEGDSVREDDLQTQRYLPMEAAQDSDSAGEAIPGSPPCLKRRKTIDLSLQRFRQTRADDSFNESLASGSSNQGERFEPSTQEFRNFMASPSSPGF